MLKLKGVALAEHNPEISDQAFTEKKSKRVLVTLDLDSASIIAAQFSKLKADSPLFGTRVAITFMGKKNLSHLLNTEREFLCSLRRWKAGGKSGYKLVATI